VSDQVYAKPVLLIPEIDILNKDICVFLRARYYGEYSFNNQKEWGWISEKYYEM